MSKTTFRQLEEKDLPDRVRWFNNKEITQYLGPSVKDGTTLEKQTEWFEHYRQGDDRKMFVIEHDGKPVGNVGLTDISKTDLNAGIFIFVGEQGYQGKGIGQEAIKFILDLGFNDLILHKIWLYVCELNEAAIALYRKTGFEQEGRLKDMWRIDGKYYDEIVMAKFNPKDKE